MRSKYPGVAFINTLPAHRRTAEEPTKANLYQTQITAVEQHHIKHGSDTWLQSSLIYRRINKPLQS